MAIHPWIPRRLVYGGLDAWGDEASRFLDELLEVHPDATLKAEVLAGLTQKAKLAGDEELFAARMGRLLTEYPDSDAASEMRKQWGDLSPIPVGSSAPDFEVVSLADPSRTITRADLEDGPYLIDFWATWCQPCIKEMPYLHKANEKYADRGLKILSVSIDEDRSKAEAFVGTKFEMPWLHGIVTTGTRGEMPTAYGVQGIPAPVLVNSEGVIVAKSYELFGDNLEKQLEKLFDEESD